MKKLLLSAVLILTFSSAYGAYNPIRNPEAVDCGEDNVFCASSCNRTDVLSACQGAEAYITDNGVGNQGAIVKIPPCPDGPTQPWPDSIEVSGGLRIIGSGRKGSANETQLEISAGGRFFGFNKDDGFQWEPSKYPHHLRMEENDPPGIGAPMNLIVVQ